MAAAAIVTDIAAMEMGAIMGTIPVWIPAVAVMRQITDVAVRTMSVSVHRLAMVWCHNDWRGVANDHSRKRRQGNAEADVDTCLRSGSGSEKNRREHYEFFHTPCWTGLAPGCLTIRQLLPTY